MPYQMSWLVEKRVIYAQLYGYVTQEDLAAYYQMMIDLAEESELLLHTFTDSSGMTGMKMSFRELQNMTFNGIHNLGWAILISPSKLNRFFASVVTQLSHKRGRQFETLEEGLHFLQEMDDSLPPIPMPVQSSIL